MALFSLAVPTYDASHVVGVVTIKHTNEGLKRLYHASKGALVTAVPTYDAPHVVGVVVSAVQTPTHREVA
jgi:hypothetical protein